MRSYLNILAACREVLRSNSNTVNVAPGFITFNRRVPALSLARLGSEELRGDVSPKVSNAVFEPFK